MTRLRREFLAVLLSCAFGLGPIGDASAQETIKLVGSRIVGGKRTTIEEHPWQVALRIKQSNGLYYLCGGSIVAQKWVLTAAHCFGGNPEQSQAWAKAGATDYNAAGVWTDVDRIIVHEQYNAATHENDLALIKLKSKPNGDTISLAPASLTIPVGQPLEVTGWGVTREGGDPSNDLLAATVPYADQSACNAPAVYNGAITDGMICAGLNEGCVDSCQGDSGGPLVSRDANNVPTLVGVVSFGEGCARKLKYGVYTRVSAYRSWIQKTEAANDD
jgi:secreted trypsin-like serine protease